MVKGKVKVGIFGEWFKGSQHPKQVELSLGLLAYLLGFPSYFACPSPLLQDSLSLLPFSKPPLRKSLKAWLTLVIHMTSKAYAGDTASGIPRDAPGTPGCCSALRR